jgi:hypothetical protein
MICLDQIGQMGLLRQIYDEVPVPCVASRVHAGLCARFSGKDRFIGQSFCSIPFRFSSISIGKTPSISCRQKNPAAQGRRKPVGSLTLSAFRKRHWYFLRCILLHAGL